MNRHFLVFIIGFLPMAAAAQELTVGQAVKLARLPLHCINTEYPNKTSHLINDQVEAVMLPSQLHPSFYDCIDWHSSVHGHRMLVRIFRQFFSLSLSL